MKNDSLYNANTEELVKARMKAKDLCFEYNNTKPSNVEKRKEIIIKLFNKTGAEFNIEPYFWCDYGYNIEIGENFYSNHNLVILDCAKVTFGDNVFIAPNCGFYTAGHPLDTENRNKGLEYANEIKIGNNIWIGANVCVLGGVEIGDGAVIGAGSVVNKSIEAGCLAFGSPCRVVRKL